MPHYYLNLYNDIDVVDEEGSDFLDLDAAIAEAARSARELMAEHVTLGRPIDLDHRMEVVDEGGTVVSVIRFGDLLTIKSN